MIGSTGISLNEKHAPSKLTLNFLTGDSLSGVCSRHDHAQHSHDANLTLAILKGKPSEMISD